MVTFNDKLARESRFAPGGEEPFDSLLNFLFNLTVLRTGYRQEETQD